jgi:glycosyltransferase involved in cell wall biosynthesis
MASESYKLSIITPTLNCASTLEATMCSIAPLLQGGGEHILVDSGSTDDTVAIARAGGSRVLYYPAGNMYAAINAGMVCAKGEWLTYVNGDDVLYASAVSEALASVPKYNDFVYGNINLLNYAGEVIRCRYSPRPAALKILMSAYSAIPQQGTLFRRAVYERMGGFDAGFKFSADYDYWSRALFDGFSFHHYRGHPLAGFRMSPRQLSRIHARQMAVEGWRICYRNRAHFSAPKRVFIPLLGFLARRLVRFV